MLERYTFYGLSDIYQSLTENELKNLDFRKLPQKQSLLFKICLHGPKAFPKDKQFTKEQTKKAKLYLFKTQHVMNIWKQDISNKKVNKYLQEIFKNNHNIQVFLDLPTNEVAPITNTMRLSDLGIKYEDVILKLMSENILPKTFLQF